MLLASSIIFGSLFLFSAINTGISMASGGLFPRQSENRFFYDDDSTEITRDFLLSKNTRENIVFPNPDHYGGIPRKDIATNLFIPGANPPLVDPPVINTPKEIFSIDVSNLDLDTIIQNESTSIKFILKLYVNLPLESTGWDCVGLFVLGAPYWPENTIGMDATWVHAYNGSLAPKITEFQNNNYTMQGKYIELNGFENDLEAMKELQESRGYQVGLTHFAFIVILDVNGTALENIEPVYYTLLEASAEIYINNVLVNSEEYSYGLLTYTAPLDGLVAPEYYMIGIAFLIVWVIGFVTSMITKAPFIMETLLMLLLVFSLLAMFTLISTELTSGWVSTMSGIGLGGIANAIAVVIGIVKWVISVGIYIGIMAAGTVFLKKIQMAQSFS